LDDTSGYCTSTCTADGDCPALAHCRDAFCRLGAPAEDGEACLTDEDCVRADTCRAEGGRSFCSHTCSRDRDCHTGTTCAVDHCVPSGAIVGEACAADMDCAAGVCLDVGGERLCTRECGAGAGCPPGLECVRGDVAAAYCGSPSTSSGGGGCSISVGAHGRSVWALLGLVSAVLVRRRRR